MLTKIETTEYTIPVSKFLSLRFYPDTRPHYYRIADLQKGLILVFQETELVGEGAGFGVPVVRYRDKEYFSGSSTLQILQKGDCTTAIKKFAFNMVSEKRFRKARIENRVMRKLARHLAELYEKHGDLRQAFEILRIKNLPISIGVQTIFVRVKPVGNVAVTYHIDPPFIRVRADFKSLKKGGLQKIFLLNEQGSRHFRKYYDSSGKVLFDKHIGTWERVEGDWACISNNSEEVGFRLWKVKDAILRRGREFLEGILDWVGLIYEVDPEKKCLNYDIEIFGSSKQK